MNQLQFITVYSVSINQSINVLLYLPMFKLETMFMCLSLCRLPALAEATYRDHFCCLASSSSASQKISVTFFSGTTEASFLIFGTEHQYGELFRVTHFWICGMSTSCLTRLWIFKRKEVGRRHMSSLEDLLLSIFVHFWWET